MVRDFTASLGSARRQPFGNQRHDDELQPDKGTGR
jgi:hypothetical protein